MPGDIICMALGSVPEDEQRSRFLAVGLSDSTVRIISLDPQVSRDNFINKKSIFI
jgi:splicing factor 3B subunit 3